MDENRKVECRLNGFSCRNDGALNGKDVYLLSLVDILVGFAKIDENLLAASNLLRVADTINPAELLVVEHR